VLAGAIALVAESAAADESMSNDVSCFTASSNGRSARSAAAQQRPPSCNASAAINADITSFVTLQTALFLFTFSSHLVTQTGSPPHLGEPSVCACGSIKRAEAETFIDVRFLDATSFAAFHIEMNIVHCEVLRLGPSLSEAAFCRGFRGKHARTFHLER
jgi:hypothetical protein